MYSHGSGHHVQIDTEEPDEEVGIEKEEGGGITAAGCVVCGERERERVILDSWTPGML